MHGPNLWLTSYSFLDFYSGSIYHKGSVVNAFELNGTPFPLIWVGDATNFPGNYISLTSKYCIPGELDTNKVKGKIVLCEDR